MAHRSTGLQIGLDANELARYSRHIMLPRVGVAGQQALREARVAVVGAGALGSPAALYLAGAGIGVIGVVDDDDVDLTNLQRQVAHTEDRVGMSKTSSVTAAVKAVNSTVKVQEHHTRLTPDNALGILANYDIVLDGTDNYSARYLVSDACVLLGKPHVWASVFQFEGQISTWWADHGPCYRCMFPTSPDPGMVPSCAEGGVFGALCGVMGSLQVTEVIKLAVGIGTPLIGRLTVYDALSSTWDTLSVDRDPDCPACGQHRTITTLQDEPQKESETCYTNGASAYPPETISATELAALIAGDSDIRLIDVRGREESSIASIPGAASVPLIEFEAGTAAQHFSPGDDIVAFCKTGGRSERALSLLPPASVGRARNLEGGVLAWIRDVDPSLPSY